MKKILFLVTLMTSFNIFSQGNSCESATVLNSNGIYTCPQITSGTYQQVCFSASVGINAKWYKFTPVSNGVVFISSNLPSNTNIDTRLSVMTGSCSSLTCFAASDNFNPLSFENRLSQVEFAVEMGIDYYIQWDSRWDNSSFEFEYSFTPSNCLPINQFAVSNPLYSTSTTTTLRWNHAIGNSENYLVEWTPDFVPQQSVNITPVIFQPDSGNFSIKTISNLPQGENISYFISSLCGTAPNYSGQSIRKGPFFSFLAKNLPYSLNFDIEFPIDNFTDGFIGFPIFQSDATTTPANYADGGAGRSAFTFNSTTQNSNLWGYSRAINLTAGQQVNISFKTRLFSFSGTPAPMSIAVSAGLSQSQSAQNNLIASFNINSVNNYTTNTTTFTAPTTDVYYFGFHNNSSPGNQTFTFLDSFTFTTTPLSNQEFLFQQLKFFPVPATENISFSNNEEVISKIEILDLNGRLIKVIVPESSKNSKINISEIEDGIYIINTTSENGSLSQKFIKY